MRIKNRLYPYPVLRPNTGDYLHSTFKCEIKPEASEEECRLFVEMRCTNKDILQMIEENKAVYAIHIECKFTYYRDLKQSKDPKFSFPIDSSEVDREIELCPVIMAIEDVDNYTNSDLDDIYDGETIVIHDGDPIAIGDQSTIDICKEKDPLKKLSSPFCFLPYPGTDEQPEKKYATIDYSGLDQLIIYLPKEDCAIFNRVQTPQNMDVIHAALCFPSLIEVLEHMKEEESLADQHKRWYAALNKKAVDNGLGEICGSDLSAYELAQRLFGYPLTRWLKGIAKESGGDNG